MEQLTVEMCAFPECERPVAPGPEGAGRPARYCEAAEHNPQTAFRERRRREAAGESDAAVERPGGDRPVSIAGASLRSVAVRLAADLERTREAIALLTDSEQLEAELAAVRADTQAEVSHAAQQEAIARRERMQADDAAEAALRAAEDASGREHEALAREQAAEARAREAEARSEQAQRAAQDAIAQAQAATAAQAAAEAAAAQTAAAAAHAERTAEEALRQRDLALERAGSAERERDQALTAASDAQRTQAQAERDSEQARSEALRAEQQAAGAERRAQQADERAQTAIERADRVEQQARSERDELRAELAHQRDHRQASELAHARAQAALDAEQLIRAQLQSDLQAAGKRLEATERARDAAIASLETAATRGSTPPPPRPKQTT